LGPEDRVIVDEGMKSVIRGLISIRHVAFKFEDLGEPEIASAIRSLCDLVEKRFTEVSR
jgi:hypothetical protein